MINEPNPSPTTQLEERKSVFAVEAEGLTKVFGRDTAVSDLTFKLPRGKIIGFIGPSGCGKTTTIRLMTGIYRPSAGSISVLGYNPARFSPAQRQLIGYMTQHFTLYPDLSVGENMNFAASLYGMGLIARNKPIKNLLDFVELGDSKGKLARNISGGMQRRLLLAATMVHNPELIFLDEPTAGIDPILRKKFWDQFEQLKEAGKSLIVTTQYVNEAAYCDYVGMMAEGRLLLLETPNSLRKIAFQGDVLDLKSKQQLPPGMVHAIKRLPYVKGPVQILDDGRTRLIVDEASTALPQFTTYLNENNVEIESLEEFLPPFDDVFVTLVQKYTNRAEAQPQAEQAGSHV